MHYRIYSSNSFEVALPAKARPADNAFLLSCRAIITGTVNKFLNLLFLCISFLFHYTSTHPFSKVFYELFLNSVFCSLMVRRQTEKKLTYRGITLLQ